MARLNEPIVPTESIESLKKRFMRQNREIARANSTQALRIRSLENEISSLLTENLSLREEVSHIKLDLENGKAQRIVDYTTELKLQLEEKLQEIGAIVSGLGNAPRVKKLSPKRGRISILQNGQSPAFRERRIEIDQEGRLPPILENKSYPRKTLDRQEVLDIVADDKLDSTDSPEIGPPPVSQFVDEDPVKIDLPRRTRTQNDDEVSEIDPNLSINLEQRRRRKDSVGATESRRSTRSEPLVGENESTGSLKAGAKRKLSVREDEEGLRHNFTESTEDFRFTRGIGDERSRNHAERTTIKATRDPSIARGVSQDTQASTSRKVLAPKSVNNSPKKASRQIREESKPSKPDALRSNPIWGPKENRPQPVPIVPSEEIQPVLGTIVAQTEPEPEPEPETPAGLDLFSPPSSQPSTAKAESRDTPPPPDLDLGIEGQRASRRARGAVSYAEPNLRDKMRRPTKELVDAVTRDEKNQRASLAKVEDVILPTITRIKAEPESEIDWREMPAASTATIEGSPLRGKTTIPDTLPSSITTHRKRRESLLQDNEADDHITAPASAIVALLAEKRKAKAAAKEQVKERAPDAPTTDLSGYEIQEAVESSRNPRVTVKEIKENTVPSKSRRYSSTPRETPFMEEGEVSDIEATRKTKTGPSRRRQSSLGLKSSASRGEISTRDGAQDRLLKRPVSSTAIGTMGPVESRNDRISARRRSMML